MRGMYRSDGRDGPRVNPQVLYSTLFTPGKELREIIKGLVFKEDQVSVSVPDESLSPLWMKTTACVSLSRSIELSR